MAKNQPYGYEVIGKIINFWRDNPTYSPNYIAKHFGVGSTFVRYQIRNYEQSIRGLENAAKIIAKTYPGLFLPEETKAIAA